MSALGMFKQLGYELLRFDENIIIFTDYDFKVHFYPKNKCFSYHDVCDTETQPISLEIYKAITQQMKELGWLDD